MPLTTRRLPREGAQPRVTVLLPRGPNILAFVSFALALVVPATVFAAGIVALTQPDFHLDWASGIGAVVVCGAASAGAIWAGIGAVRHAGGSRELEARRGLALVALGLGYVDVAAVMAFVVWSLLRAIQAIHLI